MTQYNDLVEERRKEISFEKWRKTCYCIHAQHGKVEYWYNDESKKVIDSKTDEVIFIPSPSETI
mgnify:FL=1